MYAEFHHIILHSSRDRPFSLFQNFELGKASTDKSISSQSLGLYLGNINVNANVYQNILLISRGRAIFHFQNLALGKASTDYKCNLQFLGLDLFNIKLSAKFYQTIPNGLRVNFYFFQNLNLGKSSTNPKCHLAISWATTCQYTNVYAMFHHNIPLSSRDRAILTFSEFGALQSLDRRKMTFHNLLC